MLEFNKYYFIGIGGIGMSALALYLLQKGYSVAGYDAVSSQITRKLEEHGIDIHYVDDVDKIPFAFKDKSETLIVYTPAVRQHSELAFFIENGFKVVKRSDLLGEISKDKKTIAIAGTHGKTTITAMVSHIFKKAERLNAAFVGGVIKNYKSNYIHGGIDYGWIITEADEFDRSFLKLEPYSSVISTVEPDHLDIYKNEEDLIHTFEEFASATENVVILNEKTELKNLNNRYVFRYGFGFDVDFQANNIRIENAKQVFDINYFDGVLKNVEISLPGNVNVENALAAFAISYLTGIEEEIIVSALKDFQGVGRRFDTLYKSDKRVYINDYAHHPSEIEGLREAVRKFYPGKKITAIFQPHLFTRTRDFADGFALALQKFDDVVVTDIYPAREQALEGVSSDLILNKMKNENKQYCKFDDIPQLVKDKKPEVLLTIGAGDIDNLTGEIVKIFNNLDEN